MWAWSYTSTILDVSSRWRIAISFTLRELYPIERACNLLILLNWTSKKWDERL
jgi:hypothetical protein